MYSVFSPRRLFVAKGLGSPSLLVGPFQNGENVVRRIDRPLLNSLEGEALKKEMSTDGVRKNIPGEQCLSLDLQAAEVSEVFRSFHHLLQQ